MAQVEFEEDLSTSDLGQKQYNFDSIKLPLITGFFVKFGLARDRRSAEKIMFIISIIAFLLASYFVYKLLAPNQINNRVIPALTYE